MKRSLHQPAPSANCRTRDLRKIEELGQKRNQVGLSYRIDRHDAHRRKRAPSALAFLPLRYAVVLISNASSLAATASAARGPTAPVEFALAEAHGAAIRCGAAACGREEARRRLQSEGYANHKGGEVMLSAERTSLPSRSLRAAASRGASDSRPR